MTAKQNDWIVRLNGHEITSNSVVAADALGGWLEVVDFYDRGQAKRPVVTRNPTRIITRRLYGSVSIHYRGIPILRVSVEG